MLSRALLILALVGTANAVCPNSCSGHGSCGQSDKCTCYRNWQGNDCSERTCPYTISWSEIASKANSNFYHHYTECGSKGTCDRKTGECTCLDGFEGKGCRRMSCAEFDNACSGHGTCEVLSDLVSNSANYQDLANVWDADKIQYCKCDPGYNGIACEKRMCKTGNDPLTEYVGGVAEADNVQTISITTSGTLSGSFLLGYTDWRGQEWITWAMDISTVTGTEVKEALQGLPNLAVPSVSVAVTGSTTAGVDIAVTFDSSHTPGNQPALSVYTAGCSTDGCQPYYAGLTAADAATVAATTPGTSENAECSNRGSCDYETGICACFEGYYGESCDMQTIIQ